MGFAFNGITGDELRERISEISSQKQKSLFFHLFEEYQAFLQETDSSLTFEEWLKMTGD